MEMYIKRKCGVDFRLSSRRLWKDLEENKRYNAPHLDSMRCMHKKYAQPHSYTRNECYSFVLSYENFHIFYLGLRKHFQICLLFVQ